MTARILVACSPGEMRIALLEDGVLSEYGIWRPGRPDGIGDVHRGRVLKRMPALGGAFVALADTEGFLPDKVGAASLGEGAPGEGALVNVRVMRAAQGGKGPRLALADDPAGGEQRLLARGPGLLMEWAAAWPQAAVEIDDAGELAALRPALGERGRLVRAAFSDAVEAGVAALSEPDVALAGGLRLRVHPTPALVAIDADFDGAARGAKASAQMAANLAMLPDLARQIRLRNLSGAILVDFAGLPARKRQALRPGLQVALAADRLAPRLLGFTQLGLAEIVRPRVHPPLHECLAGPHAAGLQALRAASAMVRDAPASRPILRAAPPVVAALQADPVALPALAGRLGRSLVLKSDPRLGGDAWVIEETA